MGGVEQVVGLLQLRGGGVADDLHRAAHGGGFAQRDGGLRVIAQGEGAADGERAPGEMAPALTSPAQMAPADRRPSANAP